MKLPKPTLLPIDSIATNRALLDGDDLTELMQSIKEFPGLARPVLIDKESHLLIDGLRRMRAMQLLGYTEIPVMATETIDETCEMHARVLKHGVAAQPLTTKRVFEFYRDTERQREQRTTGLRRRRRKNEDGSDRQHAMPLRKVMLHGLGDYSEGAFSALVSVYRKRESEENPEKLAMIVRTIDELERGEISIFQAKARVFGRDRYGLYGNVTSAPEQRYLLTSAVDQLAGVNTGLRHIGELHPDVTQAELLAYIRRIEQERGLLHNFLNLLRRRVTE